MMYTVAFLKELFFFLLLLLFVFKDKFSSPYYMANYDKFGEKFET